MNQAKLKTYPMTTTLAKPGAVRLPNTLHEHFRADPRGATSFKQWREDRIVELLQRPALLEIWFEAGRAWTSSVVFSSMVKTVADGVAIGPRATRETLHPYRVRLLNGTVIKEWAPTSDNVKITSMRA